MHRQHPWAYLAAACAAGLSPVLAVALISLPAWHGMAGVRGLMGIGAVAFALAFAYLLPIAVLLRRMLLFRPVPMGVVGCVPLAAIAAWMAIGAVQRLPNGSVVPIPAWSLMPGVVFYGLLGAGSGVVFFFVFRAVAGDERLTPGGAIDA